MLKAGTKAPLPGCVNPDIEPLSPQDSLAVARWAQDQDASLEDATKLILAMQSVRFMLQNLAESDFVTEHGRAPMKTLETFVLDMALDIANTYPQPEGQPKPGQTVVTLWKDKETISRTIGLFDSREEAAKEAGKLLPSFFAVQLHTLEFPLASQEVKS